MNLRRKDDPLATALTRQALENKYMHELQYMVGTVGVTGTANRLLAPHEETTPKGSFARAGTKLRALLEKYATPAQTPIPGRAGASK